MSRKKDTHHVKTPKAQDHAPADGEPIEVIVDGQPAEPADTAADQPLSADQQAIDIEGRIVDLEQELQAERSQALRVLADFQNFRRRTEEQRAELVSRAVQEFVADLLPVIDNLERALTAAAATSSYEKVVAGVEMILRSLSEVLERHGVKPIDAEGKPFDPNVHDAVMRVDATDVEENTVVEELQRGYTIGSRVIRPAKVKVASNP